MNTFRPTDNKPVQSMGLPIKDLSIHLELGSIPLSGERQTSSSPPVIQSVSPTNNLVIHHLSSLDTVLFPLRLGTHSNRIETLTFHTLIHHFSHLIVTILKVDG
jgi:hypothetical protein